MPAYPLPRPRTTASRAKAAFRKYGRRISSQEQRELDRGAELLERADRIRAAERRRKAHAKKKADKEMYDREARRRDGLSTPLAPGQARLEGFVRVTKPAAGAAKDPWEEEELDEAELLEVLDAKAAHGGCGISQAATVARAGLVRSKRQATGKLAVEARAPPVESLVDMLCSQDVVLSCEELLELGLAPAVEPCQVPDEGVPEAAAGLMLPPQQPRLRTKMITTAKITLPSFGSFSDEFELSTQDCREIG